MLGAVVGRRERYVVLLLRLVWLLRVLHLLVMLLVLQVLLASVPAAAAASRFALPLLFGNAFLARVLLQLFGRLLGLLPAFGRLLWEWMLLRFFAKLLSGAAAAACAPLRHSLVLGFGLLKLFGRALRVLRALHLLRGLGLVGCVVGLGFLRGFFS